MKGSSPRVWGQEISVTLTGHVSRIIPTRVGTSTATYGLSSSGAGSSPRVWGQDLLSNG